eukprot:jgi/Mesen1/10699/ME000090S10157
MSKFTAYQAVEANGPLQKVEKTIEEPPAGRVRVKVHACGVCHSDCFTTSGGFPGIQLPRVPGHEIAGTVDAVGPGVKLWKAGDRVGVGWYGGHCGECLMCRRGEFVVCPKMPVTGIHFDGGYGQYVVADANALAAIPDGLSFVEAAPLLCAGACFSFFPRDNIPRPEERQGVSRRAGPQFANKMGYRVVVFSRGPEKRELAMKLGAHHYFDTNADDIVAETAKLGGVRVLLATSTNAKAMSTAFATLGPLGVMMVIGAGSDDVCVGPSALISGKRSVQGHASGAASDSEDTMKFSQLTGVRSMNEVFPADKTVEAFERMVSGKATFRVVIDYDA